jgi:CDP-diacylglycerol--serine O-phosphatidyltransferase
VAPSYMMYALFLKDYGAGGFLIVFLFALCGALRLARFNAVAHAGTGSKRQFQGLPTPAAAGLLASYTLLYDIMEQEAPAHTLGFLMRQIPLAAGFAPFIMLLLSFLMVSNVPYAAFKQKDATSPRNVKLLVALIAFLTLLYFYPQNALFLLFLFYVLSGFTRIFGRREKPPAEPEEPPITPA